MLTQYPEVSSLYHVEDQYMLSDKLLVAPVLESGATKRTVHFPTKDIWYGDDFKAVPFSSNSTDSSESITFDVDMEDIPVFVRGGSIISQKYVERKASIYMKNDPISFVVALDKDGKAEGSLFVDDEMSFAYLQGFYAYYSLKFHENKFSINLIDHQTRFLAMNKIGSIFIMGSKYQSSDVAKAIYENGNEQILTVVNVGDVFTIDASQLNIADNMYIEITTSGSIYLIANGLITFIVVMLNILK